MHAEAYEWVRQNTDPAARRVLDIGGRDINGSPRPLFPAAEVYRVLDIAPGEGVEIVADAATWTPDGEYDVVVCTEVFEHTPVWPAICATAYRALAPGGLFVATMAGPGRPPHSAVDGGWLLHEIDGQVEHYANVHPDQLHQVLVDVGFVDVTTDRRHSPADTRCVARRPGGQ